MGKKDVKITPGMSKKDIALRVVGRNAIFNVGVTLFQNFPDNVSISIQTLSKRGFAELVAKPSLVFNHLALSHFYKKAMLAFLSRNASNMCTFVGNASGFMEKGTSVAKNLTIFGLVNLAYILVFSPYEVVRQRYVAKNLNPDAVLQKGGYYRGWGWMAGRDVPYNLMMLFILKWAQTKKSDGKVVVDVKKEQQNAKKDFQKGVMKSFTAGYGIGIGTIVQEMMLTYVRKGLPWYEGLSELGLCPSGIAAKNNVSNISIGQGVTKIVSNGVIRGTRIGMGALGGFIILYLWDKFAAGRKKKLEA